MWLSIYLGDYLSIYLGDYLSIYLGDYLTGLDTDTESLASLSSNLSLNLPLGGRRHSLSRLPGEERGSRVSLVRRSARLPGRREVAQTQPGEMTSEH